MTNINNIKINNNNKEEEIKMTNIKEVREIILEELKYAMESCFYMEEHYANGLILGLEEEEYCYNKLHHLRSIREILDRSIEKIYNIRVERGVLEEELGKEYDERMVALYRKSFDIDREIEKMIVAVNAINAERMEAERRRAAEKEEEEDKMDNIENNIVNILQAAEEQIDEMEEIIRSLDLDKNRKFNSYIEKQEEHLTSENNKKYYFKLTVEILKDALEKNEKEMAENDIKYKDLSIELQLMVAAAKNRLNDAKAKRKNNLKKIKATENIIEKERRREEEERRRD